MRSGGLDSLGLIPYEPATHLARGDFILAAVAAALAAALSMYLSAQFVPQMYEMNNVWFQADPRRVLSAMTDPDSHFHYRTSVHPIFSLLTTPLVGALRHFGLQPIMAGRIVVGASGFIAVGSFFLALRALGLPKTVAALLDAVFLCSATYLHWFSLIETYSLGAASICLMLLVLTGARSSRYLSWWLGSAATLSVTVTNWVLGISAAFFRLGIRRAFLVTIAALLTVIALSAFQRSLYPQAAYFFTKEAILNEHQYSQVHRSSGLAGWMPSANIRSMLVTSAVAPRPQVVRGDQAGGEEDQQIVNNQLSPLSSYTVGGWIACASWAVLTLCGIYGGWHDVARRRVYFSILAFLVSEIALHLVYGPITFLYATSFFPALVMLAAFGWFSRFRLLAVSAAAIFVIFGALTNFARFFDAVQLANVVALSN